MPEGKLLGHIISRGGIKIDPKRVCSIQEIDIPRNKKVVKSFIGKINFLGRFMQKFFEILKPITNMLKKDVVIKWSLEVKSNFQTINKSLVEFLILSIPDYTKDFFIFSFAFEETIVVVLLQKNEEGHEQPISFFSRAQRDNELKYDIIEKYPYARVKSLKAFKVYVL
jgi:hypothetical protein